METREITDEYLRCFTLDSTVMALPLPVAMEDGSVPATSSSKLGVRRMPTTESITRITTIERIWRGKYKPAPAGCQHVKK